MAGPVPRKLIVIGDSGAYGWGDPDQGGWCERLRRHWMGLPDGPVIYNLGVRGDGLERVAARLGQEVGARGELRRQRPQGILLSVGLNDTARVGRRDGRPQLAPEAFLYGLQQLLREAQELAPVLVMGLSPVLEEAMPFAEVLWYSLEAVRHYEALLEEACLEADVPFLPLVGHFLADPRWGQCLEPDGIHLNAEGHHRIHQALASWPALLDWAGLASLSLATPLA